MLLKKLVRAVLRRIIWCAFRIIPIDNRKILVSNFYGRGYGDSPKYIVEYLLTRKKDIKIVWVVNNVNEAKSLPLDVDFCVIDSVKHIYHLSTAKVWIDNCRKPVFFKRKNQKYLQTWHGFALKRIEADVKDNLGIKYVNAAIKDSQNIDLIVSDSKFMTNIYKNSFWYNGDIVDWGSPKNDIIFENTDLKEKINSCFNLKPETKTVLYAPTFRADGSIEAYSVDYLRLKQACEKRFDGEYAVLVRFHPNVVEKTKILNYDEKNIVNASYYPDMQELLAGCDIVISDYSSLMFDFVLSFKPCFQFATDIEDYKKDRNFYFEIDKLPFSLSKSNDELEKNILNFDETTYRVMLDDFFVSVGMILNGGSSQKCGELVLQWCYEKNM